MKTIADLFQIIGVAVAQNNKYKHWFVDYSGHVDKIRITLYKHGWSEDAVSEKIETKLTEDGIQSVYWFIKSNL
jgi:hypothetical protein